MTEKTEDELFDAIRKAQDFLRSDEIEAARKEVREVDEQAIELNRRRLIATDAIDRAEKTEADARAALRAFYSGPTESADEITAAVAGMADTPPEAEPLTEAEALEDDTDWLVASEQPEAPRVVINGVAEATDERLAEARAADDREARNGKARRFSPWA